MEVHMQLRVPLVFLLVMLLPPRALIKIMETVFMSKSICIFPDTSHLLNK